MSVNVGFGHFVRSAPWAHHSVLTEWGSQPLGPNLYIYLFIYLFIYISTHRIYIYIYKYMCVESITELHSKRYCFQRFCLLFGVVLHTLTLGGSPKPLVSKLQCANFDVLEVAVF